MDGATTPWEKMAAGAGTNKLLKGTHTLWSRLMNGEHFFCALPKHIPPVNGLTLGYKGIADALKAAGLSS
jgi:hypothetical protein